jgi:hypothetical protein
MSNGGGDVIVADEGTHRKSDAPPMGMRHNQRI